MCPNVVSAGANYSHDGLHDQLTHCAAPPLFYTHLARVIAGCTRTAAPLTLVSISIPIDSRSEQTVSMAHAINLVMRHEDLCGRIGSYEFVIALAGDLSSGMKLIERVRAQAGINFSSEIVQWVFGETPLQLLFRLDLEAEAILN